MRKTFLEIIGEIKTGFFETLSNCPSGTRFVRWCCNLQRHVVDTHQHASYVNDLVQINFIDFSLTLSSSTWQKRSSGSIRSDRRYIRISQIHQVHHEWWGYSAPKPPKPDHFRTSQSGNWRVGGNKSLQATNKTTQFVYDYGTQETAFWVFILVEWSQRSIVVCLFSEACAIRIVGVDLQCSKTLENAQMSDYSLSGKWPLMAKQKQLIPFVWSAEV
jgi:hypothetical protein